MFCQQCGRRGSEERDVEASAEAPVAILIKSSIYHELFCCINNALNERFVYSHPDQGLIVNFTLLQ